MKTRKDKRKPFTGAKAVDKQCRNNGKCEYCKGNRTYAVKKKQDAIAEILINHYFYRAF
jgi:hypothetical protein